MWHVYRHAIWDIGGRGQYVYSHLTLHPAMLYPVQCAEYTVELEKQSLLVLYNTAKTSPCDIVLQAPYIEHEEFTSLHVCM